MWTLPPSDSVLHILSFIAVAAQAMTAALAAGKRSMDWAGVCMLGCITALGGGTIRDVLLGHYPLLWVQHPSFLLLAAGAALVTIVMAQLGNAFAAAGQPFQPAAQFLQQCRQFLGLDAMLARDAAQFE